MECAMSSRRSCWVPVLILGSAANVTGCAQVLGIDEDYQVVGSGGGGTGGMGACGGTSGVVGKPGEACPENGMAGCESNASSLKVICGADLKWAATSTCDDGELCNTAMGAGQGTCKPVVAMCAGKCGGDVVCDGQTRVKCGPDLVTSEELDTCVAQACVAGVCEGVCEPGQVKCSEITANTPQSCDASGAWQNEPACVDQTCVAGACEGVCAPGQVGCSGNTPQSCDIGGLWESGVVCPAQAPFCNSGVCVPPSCNGLAALCGPAGDESCCASSVVPGGTYNRSNDASFPATVSEFRLDRFEITVGRFRAFFEAYPGSKPAAGAGAPPNPMNAGNGWDVAWDASLPVDQSVLKAAVTCSDGYQTWTDAVGANENLPMNCITWYEAFAFCAWDGGRLPTEAEWNYAVAGGEEQREYPWSSPPSATTIDSSYALYNAASLLVVGSKSMKGDGKWGQADLAGSVWEWNQDWFNAYENPCNDCASVQGPSGRVRRGGGWSGVASVLLSSYRGSSAPDYRGDAVGVRCARTP